MAGSAAEFLVRWTFRRFGSYLLMDVGFLLCEVNDPREVAVDFIYIPGSCGAIQHLWASALLRLRGVYAGASWPQFMPGGLWS